jgi:hypothetical protein
MLLVQGRQIFLGPHCWVWAVWARVLGARWAPRVGALCWLRFCCFCSNHCSRFWLVSVWDSLAVGVCLTTVAHSQGCEQCQGLGRLSGYAWRQPHGLPRTKLGWALLCPVALGVCIWSVLRSQAEGVYWRWHPHGWILPLKEDSSWPRAACDPGDGEVSMHCIHRAWPLHLTAWEQVPVMLPSTGRRLMGWRRNGGT